VPKLIFCISSIVKRYPAAVLGVVKIQNACVALPFEWALSCSGLYFCRSYS